MEIAEPGLLVVYTIASWSIARYVPNGIYNDILV